MTTHSFRRSGASELSRQGVGWSEIMEYGRWNADRAAREYIRKGEVAVYRSRNDLSKEVWQQATRWAQQASQAWMIFGAAVIPDSDGDEKVKKEKKERKSRKEDQKDKG